MSNSPSAQEFQGMIKHLDALYAMAQVLTLDAEKASVLVEDTFKRALSIRERNPVAPGDRRHLMQLLIQVFNEKKHTPPPLFEPPPLEKATSPSSRESFKQRIVKQFLSRAVPASFAMIDDADRVVLTLCEANQLSHADVALILGGDSDYIAQQLDLAKKRLVEKVTANAPPAILEILKGMNPNDWLPLALRTALKSEFNTLPPTLEPKIQSVFTNQNPEEARRALASSAGQKDKVDGRTRFSKGIMTLFLILSAGFVGYIGSSVFQQERDVNLLSLSASKAPRIELVHKTANLMEAETFVQQQLQWRLTLPAIADGELSGVGISEIAEDVRVPVFVYDDATSTDDITIYAYTYALLDEYADRIYLEGDILNAIAGDQSFDVHDLSDNEKFVIWRNANDIFMAVTAGDPQALRDRISVE